MINDTPEQLAADIRTFAGDNWYTLGERAEALSPAMRAQLFTTLVTALPFVDEEQQTRSVGLMLTTDEAQAMPYFRTLLQTAPSTSIKCEICWILEGRADASWIPDLSQLVVHDPDTGVRIAAGLVLGFIGDPQAIPALRAAQADIPDDIKGQRLRDLVQKILADLESQET